MLWLLVVGLLAIWLLVVFEDNNLFKKFVITKKISFEKNHVDKTNVYFNSQLSSFGIDTDNPRTPGAVSKYNHSEIDAVHFNLKKHRI